MQKKIYGTKRSLIGNHGEKCGFARGAAGRPAGDRHHRSLNRTVKCFYNDVDGLTGHRPSCVSYIEKNKSSSASSAWLSCIQPNPVLCCNLNSPVTHGLPVQFHGDQKKQVGLQFLKTIYVVAKPIKIQISVLVF